MFFFVPHLVLEFERVSITIIIEIDSVPEGLDTFFLNNEFVPDTLPRLEVIESK